MTESMSYGLDSASPVSNTLLAIQGCIDQLVNTLHLTRESVRAAGNRFIGSRGSGGGSGCGDYLQVDKILRLVKKLAHHIQQLKNTIINHQIDYDSVQCIQLMQQAQNTLEQHLQKNRFFHNTFGWSAMQIIESIKHTIGYTRLPQTT